MDEKAEHVKLSVDPHELARFLQGFEDYEEYISHFNYEDIHRHYESFSRIRSGEDVLIIDIRPSRSRPDFLKIWTMGKDAGTESVVCDALKDDLDDGYVFERSDQDFFVASIRLARAAVSSKGSSQDVSLSLARQLANRLKGPMAASYGRRLEISYAVYRQDIVRAAGSDGASLQGSQCAFRVRAGRRPSRMEKSVLTPLRFLNYQTPRINDADLRGERMPQRRILRELLRGAKVSPPVRRNLDTPPASAPRLPEAAADAAAFDVDVFKVLADETRWKILHQVLGFDEPSSAKQIHDSLGIGVDYSMVTRHLQKLAEAGLVGYRKQGTEKRYFAERDALREFFLKVAASVDRPRKR